MSRAVFDSSLGSAGWAGAAVFWNDGEHYSRLVFIVVVDCLVGNPGLTRVETSITETTETTEVTEE